MGVVVDGVPGSICVLRTYAISTVSSSSRAKRVSPRNEHDRLEVFSGIENGVTLGSPVHLSIKNRDTRPEDYAAMANIYRPSHADYTTEKIWYPFLFWRGRAMLVRR